MCDLDEVRDVHQVTTLHSTVVESPMYTSPCVGETVGVRVDCGRVRRCCADALGSWSGEG